MSTPVASILLVVGPLLQASPPSRTGLPDRLAQPAAVFLGHAGKVGELRVFDAGDGSQLGGSQTGIELLPIDFVGRTQLERELPDRPRLLADLPGASRLRLPAGRGMLHRYRRVLGAGWTFGFLLLRAGGGQLAFGERSGTGAGLDQDPYVARLAVAPDGRAILVGTRSEAGGDLIEIHLETGAERVLTPALAPLELSDSGLWLGAEWGFGVATTGIWRFRRGPNSLAARVPFRSGEEPTYFSGQAVMSAGRVFGLATAGSASDALHPYAFTWSGRAVRGHPQAAPISDAGFLPESLAGPRLAVSDDGLSLAWTIDAPLSREALFARLDVAPAGEEITTDAYFLDTLDEIGVLGIFGSRLRIGVGDDPLDGDRGDEEAGLESMDLFEVDLLAAGNPSFTNLTLSSGDATPPFLSPGTIELDWMLRIPAAGAYWIHDGNGERVLALDDGQVGPRLLLDEVKDVYWVEAAGDWLACAARRTFEPSPRELYRMPADLSQPATVLVPGDDDLDHLAAHGRADGRLIFLTATGPGAEWLHLVHVPSRARVSHPAGPGNYGSTLGFTARGGVLVRLGDEAADGSFEVWSAAGARVPLQLAPAPGAFLPGQ